MSDLRQSLLKLANDVPATRKHLLPLLRTAGWRNPYVLNANDTKKFMDWVENWAKMWDKWVVSESRDLDHRMNGFRLHCIADPNISFSIISDRASHPYEELYQLGLTINKKWHDILGETNDGDSWEDDEGGEWPVLKLSTVSRAKSETLSLITNHVHKLRCPRTLT